MTDEERGREKYEKEARNWPSPVGWVNLPKGTQHLWIQRAKKKDK